MVSAVPPHRLARLPRPLRVWAARRAVARLKHDAASRANGGTADRRVGGRRAADRATAVDAGAPVDRRGGERRGADRRAARPQDRPVDPRSAAERRVERRVGERRDGERRVDERRGGERRTGERRSGVGSIESRRAVGRGHSPAFVETVIGGDGSPGGEAVRSADGHGTAPTRESPTTSLAPSIASPATPARAPRRVREEALSIALLAVALACSAAIGYVAGGGARSPLEHAPALAADGSPIPLARAVTGASPRGAAEIEGIAGPAPPRLGGALAVVTGGAAADGARGPDVHGGPVDPLWSEIGKVRAEILRLRVLFRRLADVAELDDGEFDLDLEPFELPAVRQAADALDLSIRALDPISEQGERMARIFDERRAAHDRRVGGRVARGTIRTSGFGLRRAPFGGRRQLHRGVDYAGIPGTPIHALADGIVAYSGPNGGYGNLVEIEHGDGYRTRYAHNRDNLVAVGDRVAKGEVVATLGSSGRSTGPHVHVEVRRDGAPLDPAAFVR